MHKLVYYYPEGHEKHAQANHPERPERIHAIVEALKEYGLWDEFPKIASQQVTINFLSHIHSPRYLDTLQEMCRYGESLDMDTYTTPASWDLAIQTAGGAIAVSDMVWEKEAHYGFALTRPPGHHATSLRGMGFCLLNNIAISAEHLIRNKGAKRLAILDFDLHHGNGTQDIFWKRGDVFYISTHQSPLYPGSGSIYETGEGEGEGKTANFPLPPGSGDEAFEQVGEIILQLLDRYQPEMLLVSYGFDPHWRDPLGHLLLSARGYGNLINCMRSWAEEHCEGRVVLFLEGGYDLEAAKACSVAVIKALLGMEFMDTLGASPRPEGKSWMSVFKEAKEYWGI